MKQNNLNAVLVGIINSLTTKDVNNNYLLDTSGKVLKSSGKEIMLWNDELYHTPSDTFFVFNPFQELTTHDDSPSLSYLKKMLNIELNTLLMKLIPAVMSAAVTIKVPNKRQLRFIGEGLGNVDAKALAYLERLYGEVKLNHRSRSIVDISLHTSHPVSRDVDGMKYGSIKSPLLQSMAYWSPKDKLFGIAGPSKEVINTLRTALRVCLPNDWEDGMYFVGNKHSTIPRNKALHDLYSDILEHMTDVVTTLKIKDLEIPEIDDAWTSGLSRIGVLLQGIPRDIFGTIGAIRNGVAAEEPSNTRIRISEGFGANTNQPAQYGANVPAGGLMSAMQATTGYQQLNPSIMSPPPGYALVAIGNMGQQPAYGNQAFGQPAQGAAPAGGLMGMMATMPR